MEAGSLFELEQVWLALIMGSLLGVNNRQYSRTRACTAHVGGHVDPHRLHHHHRPPQLTVQQDRHSKYKKVPTSQPECGSNLLHSAPPLLLSSYYSCTPSTGISMWGLGFGKWDPEGATSAAHHHSPYSILLPVFTLPSAITDHV
jgi:hypothetical protein